MTWSPPLQPLVHGHEKVPYATQKPTWTPPRPTIGAHRQGCRWPRYPGQQVLDVQTKLVTHAIRIAAFNTTTALARAIRVHTGYARANDEAHARLRQALTGNGVLTVRLDPLPDRARQHRHCATV
jgi:hypothetical protein